MTTTTIEPTKSTYTREEMIVAAKRFLFHYWGEQYRHENPDKYMERFGMLCAFIDDNFQP